MKYKKFNIDKNALLCHIVRSEQELILLEGASVTDVTNGTAPLGSFRFLQPLILIISIYSYSLVIKESSLTSFASTL